LNFWVWYTSHTTTQEALIFSTTAASNYIEFAYHSGLGNWFANMNTVFLNMTGQAPTNSTWYNISIYDDGTNAGVRVNDSYSLTVARAGTGAGTANGVTLCNNADGTQSHIGRVDQVFY